MAYTLSAMELIAVAQQLPECDASADIRGVLSALDALAWRIADHLGVVSVPQEPTGHGDGYVVFGPRNDGDPIPDLLQGMDNEEEWDPEDDGEIPPDPYRVAAMAAGWEPSHLDGWWERPHGPGRAPHPRAACEMDGIEPAALKRDGHRLAQNVIANPGYYVRPDDAFNFTPTKTYPTAEEAWSAWESER